MLRSLKSWPILLGVVGASLGAGVAYVQWPSESEDTSTTRRVERPREPVVIEPAVEPAREPRAPKAAAPTAPKSTEAMIAEVEDIDAQELVLPQCEFGEVISIVSGDPSYAFASIRTQNGKGSYKVGQSVGDRVVTAIDWDSVAFRDDDGGCTMVIGVPMPKAKKQAPPKMPAYDKHKPQKFSDAIAQKISKIGDHHYKLDRDVFEMVRADPVGLRGTRAKTVCAAYKRRKCEPDEKKIGVLLKGRGTYEGSLLYSLGIRTDDVLVSINGHAAYDPQKALEAYGKLMSSDKLEMKVIRDGQPITIRYDMH